MRCSSLSAVGSTGIREDSWRQRRCLTSGQVTRPNSIGTRTGEHVINRAATGLGYSRAVGCRKYRHGGDIKLGDDIDKIRKAMAFQYWTGVTCASDIDRLQWGDYGYFSIQSKLAWTVSSQFVKCVFPIRLRVTFDHRHLRPLPMYSVCGTLFHRRNWDERFGGEETLLAAEGNSTTRAPAARSAGRNPTAARSSVARQP